MPGPLTEHSCRRVSTPLKQFFCARAKAGWRDGRAVVQSPARFEAQPRHRKRVSSSSVLWVVSVSITDAANDPATAANDVAGSLAETLTRQRSMASLCPAFGPATPSLGLALIADQTNQR